MVHVIFWPIIAVFVIWGFERYGNPVGGAAAIVNDHTISLSQYRNALQQTIEFYQKRFGGNFDERMQKQFGVRRSTLDQLIAMQLIVDNAGKLGLQATDLEVRDTIVNIPFLQKDGRFSRENYDGLLRYRHMTANQIENDVRQDLVRRKTDDLFEKEVRPSLLEVEKEKVLRSMKMNVEFLAIDKPMLATKVSLGKDQVENFLKDQGHFKEVQTYYDTHRAEFSKPEEVRARHILVKATKGNAAEERVAREKISKIQGELKADNFAELAKKYSDDPGSKEKSGDLGFFTRERIVPEFSNAAFSLEPGKVSAPLQSDFGFHLIRVEEKHPAETTSFDDAKKNIAKKMIAEEKVDKTLKEVEKKISTTPEGAIEELQSLDKSPKWEETGNFTAADDMVPKLGREEDLANAALSLTKEKPVYPGLVKSGPMIYVLRLKKLEPAPAPDLTRLAEDLGRDHGRNIFAAWAETLRSDATIKINEQVVGGEEPAADDMQ